MTIDDRSDEQRNRDHPQTTHLESDARGSATRTDERGEVGGGEDAGRDEAGPGGTGDSQLSPDEAEAVRRHAQGFRTIGDSIDGGAGLDVGSGTGADTGDLGGGGQGVGGTTGGTASPGGTGR